MATLPSLGADLLSTNSIDSRHELIDLAGDGQLDLVRFQGSVSGYYERTQDGRWESFIPFTFLPRISFSDPNVRFVDLTGDGHADILITENQVLSWYPSLAETGFGQNEKVPQALDEEKGPRLVFADGTQSIYLADMSGDGLTDLVRIRNGEVCYWPNLGYGSFGTKVTMDKAPWFDSTDQFNHERIRLADIDGSGVTDIIYLNSNGVHLYFNQSGNSWADAYMLTNFPQIENLSSVMLADLFSNGTACLIWSSPSPSVSTRPMRYIDLMGTQDKPHHKPHLLVSVKNNLGAETKISYAPSTKFYLADKLAGKPWLTRLPFPVHVVEHVKVYDLISRNRFVTRYTYHHGYFDGDEREFRGFGFVEQLDTEEFAALNALIDNTLPSAANIDEATHVPPVLTKTWFHTGLSSEMGNFVSRQFENEYYKESGLTGSQFLPDTIIPAECTAQEQPEACRALKGAMLRQEIYARDKTSKEELPYIVTEQNFTIRRLQPQDNNRNAVFLPHPREAITYLYERNPADPRVSHSLTLEVDDFGNEVKQASVSYGRRQPDPDPDPLHQLQQADHYKQTQRLITYTENRVTNIVDDEDSYLTPLLCESRIYELTGDDYIPTGDAGRFQIADFVQPDPGNPDLLIHIFDSEINYEDQPTNGKQRRLIEQVRTLYRPDDLGTAENDPLTLLPLGMVKSRALSGEAYKLAFTPGLLAHVFQRAGQALLPNPADVLAGGDGGDKGGYLPSQHFKEKGTFPNTDPDDHWWIPTGRFFMSPEGLEAAAEELEYASKHFFLPLRYRDPFHTETASTETFITFDTYDLLMLESRDPVGNLVTVGRRLPDGQIDPDKPRNDYRVLQPRLITDPNGNRTEVLFDALGMVAGTAVQGKDDSVGDTLGEFEADLTQTRIDEFYDASDPHVPAPNLLKDATTRIIYDLHLFRLTHEAHPGDPTQWLPVYAATLARETHINDPSPPGGLKIQISFSYSDGFGREIQSKIQAEPGPVIEGGPVVSPRWVGGGWTVFNNKGKLVRQYEPFFSQLAEKGHSFEFLVRVGVSPILFYDPVERVVVTLHPNNTYEKVVFDPWRQVSYDVNDTVAAHGTQTGDPRTDLDIQGYVEKYFVALNDPNWKPWVEQRQGGMMGAEEQTAADKAAAHANTPTTAYFDTLGRPFLTIAHNRFEHNATTVDETYFTRIELDIEGNQRQIRDAIVQNGDVQGRIVMRYDYDMLGNRIHQLSMEAGERWMLNDVIAKPIRAWDSRGHTHRIQYDPLRRPLRTFVIGADPADLSREVLTERMVYGEKLRPPADKQLNLRGKLFLHLDQVGVVRNESHDFKGNLVRVSRRLAKQYKRVVDWHAVDNDDLEVLQAALPPLLETETFASRTTYDALNRLVQVIAPRSDQPGSKRNIIQPVYNEASLLEQVHAWLGHPTEPEGLLDANIVPPSPVGVNNIDYNAKAQRLRIDFKNGVSAFYDYDRQTFRLAHLVTLRNAVNFPDDCPEHPQADWPGCQVQNLHYTYDPVGNITHIRDDAQQTIFFGNKRVEPSSEYTYDAVYRLIDATGREHLGQVPGGGALQAPIPPSHTDDPRVNLAHPGDGNAMGNYSVHYEYDFVGNILEVVHRGTEPSHPGWRLPFNYNEPSLIQSTFMSNRLTGHGDDVVFYTYDVHGNMTSMPHMPFMQWDYQDRLKATSKQIVNNGGTPEITYYIYDGSGQRVRKVTDWQAAAGEIPKRKEERYYLGGFEIYRKYNGDGNTIALERETLDIMDDTRRIALVETRTQGDDGSPEELIRYQFDNQLGSVSLELDEQAHIINYEEYYPYGSTSFQAVRRDIEVPTKRYRYVGKERDEENGLYYYGARYYAPWIGRWTSCDPAGIIDGLNLYSYVTGNPIRLVDRKGTNGEDIDRTPRVTGIYQGQLAKEPATTLANDPAFKDVAKKVWSRMGSTDYKNFSRNLNDEIKTLLRGKENHPLKQLLRIDKKGNLRWKSGFYKGEKLNYAHALGQNIARKVGANPAVHIDLDNLSPTGKLTHLAKSGLGHPEEIFTKQGKYLTPEAAEAIRQGTADIEPPPKLKGGQREVPFTRIDPEFSKRADNPNLGRLSPDPKSHGARIGMEEIGQIGVWMAEKADWTEVGLFETENWQQLVVVITYQAAKGAEMTGEFIGDLLTLRHMRESGKEHQRRMRTDPEYRNEMETIFREIRKSPYGEMRWRPKFL